MPELIEKDGITYLIKKDVDFKTISNGAMYGFFYNGTLYSYMELVLMEVLDEMQRVEILWHYPEKEVDNMLCISKPRKLCE